MTTQCPHGRPYAECPAIDCFLETRPWLVPRSPVVAIDAVTTMQPPPPTPPQPAQTRDEAMARVEAALALLPSDAERALLYLHLHEGLDWRVSAARLLLQGKGWRLA